MTREYMQSGLLTLALVLVAAPACQSVIPYDDGVIETKPWDCDLSGLSRRAGLSCGWRRSGSHCLYA